MNIKVDTSQLIEMVVSVKKDIDILANQIELLCEKYPFLDIEVKADIDKDRFIDGLDVRTHDITSDCGLLGKYCVIGWS